MASSIKVGEKLHFYFNLSKYSDQIILSRPSTNSCRSFVVEPIGIVGYMLVYNAGA